SCRLRRASTGAVTLRPASGDRASHPTARTALSAADSTPHRDPMTGSDAASAVRDPLSISAEVKAGLRVLIVDDDRTLREGCASVLQMDGFNVSFTGRGDEALEIMRRRKFDIVLVDLYMTPISGME